MNVKTRTSDRTMTPLGATITIFMFLILPLILIVVFIKVGIELSNSSYYDVLYSLAPLFIILVFFLIVGFILFFYLLKKPKKYKAKLMHKKEMVHNNLYIICLGFDVYNEKLKKYHSSKHDSEEKEESDFWCYLTEQNNLTVGKDYFIYIKEFNWSIKRIEEYMES